MSSSSNINVASVDCIPASLVLAVPPEPSASSAASVASSAAASSSSSSSSATSASAPLELPRLEFDESTVPKAVSSAAPAASAATASTSASAPVAKPAALAPTCAVATAPVAAAPVEQPSADVIVIDGDDRDDVPILPAIQSAAPSSSSASSSSAMATAPSAPVSVTDLDPDDAMAKEEQEETVERIVPSKKSKKKKRSIDDEDDEDEKKSKKPKTKESAAKRTLDVPTAIHDAFHFDGKKVETICSDKSALAAIFGHLGYDEKSFNSDLVFYMPDANAPKEIKNATAHFHETFRRVMLDAKVPLTVKEAYIETAVGSVNPRLVLSSKLLDDVTHAFDANLDWVGNPSIVRALNRLVYRLVDECASDARKCAAALREAKEHKSAENKAKMEQHVQCIMAVAITAIQLLLFVETFIDDAGVARVDATKDADRKAVFRSVAEALNNVAVKEKGLVFQAVRRFYILSGIPDRLQYEEVVRQRPKAYKLLGLGCFECDKPDKYKAVNHILLMKPEVCKDPDLDVVLAYFAHMSRALKKYNDEQGLPGGDVDA